MVDPKLIPNIADALQPNPVTITLGEEREGWGLVGG
jgi:hypothetical protein